MKDLNCPALTLSLQEIFVKEGRKVNEGVLLKEFDMINRIVLKTSINEFRRKKRIKEDESVCDYITDFDFDMIKRLQELDVCFVEAEIAYRARKAGLTTIYNKAISKLLASF